MDYAQEQLHCCGFENYTDWKDTDWGKSNPGLVPKSCCLVQDDSKCSRKMADKEQIYNQVNSDLEVFRIIHIKIITCQLLRVVSRLNQKEVV